MIDETFPIKDEDGPMPIASFIMSNPEHMTLPGTSKEIFEAFFQFDDDEPFKFQETKSKLTIELTGTPQSKVMVGEYTASQIMFRMGDKEFKIFLKPKIKS